MIMQLKLIHCVLSILPFVSSSSIETLIGVVGKDFVMIGADSSIASSITVQKSNVDKIHVLVDPFPSVQQISGKEEQQEQQQQVIAVASSGDFADSEELLQRLKVDVTALEYETSVGCDVKCLYNGRSNSNTNISPSGFDADIVAHQAREIIATSLRSQARLQTCLLVAGMVRCSYPTTTPVNSNMQQTVSISQRLQEQVQVGERQLLEQESKESQQESPNKKQSSHTAFIKKQKRYGLEPKLYWLDEYGSIQNLVEFGAHGYGANFCLSILDRNYNPSISKQDATKLIQSCFQQLRTRYIINAPTQPCIKCIDSNGCHIVSS